MEPAGHQLPTINREPELIGAPEKARLQFLRIALPQSMLTPHQLTALARMVQHCSPRYGLRLRSATELEVASFTTHQPWMPELLLRRPFAAIRSLGATPPLSTIRVHVPGAHLRVRQLRVLAALMHSEGLAAVRIGDSETLLLEYSGRGREAVFRLGLREVGLITV